MSKLRDGGSAIALNGSGGAYVAIPATQFSRHVVLKEDPSMSVAGGGAGFQGFQYQLASEAYAYTHVVNVGDKVELGLTSAIQGSGFGSLVGMPAWTDPQNGATVAATEYMKAKSLTATATKLSVLEED